MANPIAGVEAEVRAAYESVRTAGNGVDWLTIEYVDGDGNRVYAYARYDNRFAFITWIGPSVGALKKAKVSTDKALVKEVMPQFGKEILADTKPELAYDKVKAILDAASGAAYGTGK